MKQNIHTAIIHHVCENLEEQINSPKCRAIKKHLKICPECTMFLSSLKKTVALYKTLPIPPLTPKARRQLRAALGIKNT